MRLTIVALATLALVAGASHRVAAADPVTGAISCVTEGELFYRTPYLPGPLSAPLTKPLHVRGKTESAVCDASGVSGGKFPILIVEGRLSGKLAPGASCESFLGTVPLTGHVKLRWRGNKLGTYVTVGTSKATVASAAFDGGTESWVLVTNPIKNGAFAGSIVTMRFHMYDAASFAESCATIPFRFTSWRATADNPWTIDVQ